ncbi:MAG: HAMP domain-containing histidine kinase [Oscillospiraceae bacterium]|nr:HAMP domain-containing histidine kinase [Oscillospiraceae bacterium]
MLKKMRFRLVVTIMTIVTVILAAAIGSIMHFTSISIAQESIQMMRRESFREPLMPNHHMPPVPPKNENDNLRIPSIRMRKDPNGEIQVDGGGFFDVSDKELISKIADSAYASDETVGVIPEYNLRFLKTEDSLILTDISGEKMMLRGLVKNALVIGFIGWLLFFVISIFLARWLTKPTEQAWNEQKQFIADASHELKTPLTVIMTNAEMLADSEYSDCEKAEFSNHILSMAKRMRGLVESLLQLSGMDNGTARTQYEEMDFSKLVSDSILPFEPLFFEKGMMLQSDIAGEIHIFGDKNRIRQVIDILLDNALKYSDADAPVQLKLSASGTECTLTVSGKGTPMSEPECKAIFRRFYRADQSRNDGNSYGLGLSIAEGIVKAHNGKIWATGETDSNVFHVQFDLKKQK